MQKVVVIGAGASGLMAAGFAAMRGLHVTVLDRNEKAGKKLYITGKGRCNVTNIADLDAFFEHIPSNPKFLQSAIRTFDAEQTVEFFENHGVPMVVERGGRVFPQSQKASDITRALVAFATQSGATLELNRRVQNLLVNNGIIQGVVLEDGRKIMADAVILCTGGMTYPATGSTGDGYRIAQEIGHHIIAPRASLVPLETMETWPYALSGLSLKNVRLTAIHESQIIFSQMGEMLLTHFGISGPLVLSLSSVLPDDFKNTQVLIDLKPALSLQQLDERLLTDFAENNRKAFCNALFQLFPKSLVDIMVDLSQIPPLTSVSQITKNQRLAFGQLIKNVPLHIKALRPPEEAVITRGGIDTREIVPSTMQSRLVQGLYFAGEVIDVDGCTGGYNLQIAFSTGALAGKKCCL